MAVKPTEKPLLSVIEDGSVREVQQGKNNSIFVRVTSAFLASAAGIAALVIRFGSCEEISNEECEREYGILKPAEVLCVFSIVAGIANEVFRCCFPRSPN